MTQFLFAALRNPRLPAGYASVDTRDVEGLEDAARRIFPNAEAVVKVAPIGDEIDLIVNATRREMASGAGFDESPLGLLGGLAAQCDFVLFWANDHENLPLATTMTELREALTPQILETAGNWELYARFVRTSPARNG